jgi:hypothetical protein
MNQIIEAVVDQIGNIKIPKTFHDELGLIPGKKWVVEHQSNGDLSLHPVPTEHTQLIRKNGVLVATGEIDEEVAKNWLSIINSNRERDLFRDESDEGL